MEIWRTEDQVKLMEVLLNLAWLAIAIGSFAIAGLRLARTNPTKASAPSRLQCIDDQPRGRGLFASRLHLMQVVRQ